MPAGDGINFTYGEYVFDPRPLFSMNKEFIKTPANTGLISKYTVSLNGHILPTGIDLDNNKGGLGAVFNGVTDLREAFTEDFKLLKLQCEDQDPIISGFPKVISIDVQNAGDNYVQRADYTINLELVSIGGTGSDAVGTSCSDTSIGDISAYGLISATEEYSIEFLDERVGNSAGTFFTDADIPAVFSVQKTITAQGAATACSDGTYVEPWIRAKAYCKAKIAKEGTTYDWQKSAQDLMPLEGASYVYNNMRTITVNALDGSASVTETYIVTNHDGQLGLEDFEVTCERGVDNPFTTVNIAGNIVGLTAIDYTTTPPSTPAEALNNKFDRAQRYWENDVRDVLYDRASEVFTRTSSDNYPWKAGTILNTVPISQSVGYNPIAGSLTYNFAYDDRTLVYDQAISETISYSYSQRPDIFASIPIIGKSNGPLLQDMNTSGPYTTEVSIDAFVKPDTSESPATLVSAYATVVSAAAPGATAYVTSDTRTWEPRLGHFTWNKTWEQGQCG